MKQDVDTVSDTPKVPRAPKRAYWFRWRSSALWCGLAGLGCAVYGQKLVWVDHEVVLAIRWYAIAIVIALTGWLGTYKNKSMLVMPIPAVEESAPRARRFLPRGEWWRYLVAIVGFGIAIYCASLIHMDYFSAAGGWGWLAGIVIMALAFVREKRKPVVDLDSGIVEAEDRTDPGISRRTEAIIVVAIFLLAIFFRLYRLDDWATGMHGDEGEAGVDALNILAGNRVSPFMAGWFGQSNFYYYGVAAGIKLFGASLFGDRIFAVVMGTLMLVTFYPLVRMWFGIRTAIIATIFLAISDVTLQFTRMEASNIVTPFSLVTGFYFLFLGLRTRLFLPFVLSGFGFMFGLYFYNGSRLTPFLLVAVLGYLFVLMPIVRLPGGYRALRALQPGLPRARLLYRAAGKQFGQVRHYFLHVVMFLMACIAVAAPFWVYYSDHQQEQNGRAIEKSIFSNAQLMLDRYGQSHQVSHAPLYLGLRWPTQNDIYPVVPVFFEPTPASVELASDGFWPRVVWAQTVTTLSILTYRFDASSFYTFTGEPAAKPIEAALIILGLAWALWRWRDTRMAMLSLWFWSAIFAGGVLTIDAPYMARIIGIVPVMAIFAAITLSKLSAEAMAQFALLAVLLRRKITLRKKIILRAGQVVVLGTVLSLMCFLTLENFNDYFQRYLATNPYPETTGQAAFVRDMNRKAEAESKPTPYYYDVGRDFIYWGHGTNRYLNHDTSGQDMINPADTLPLPDSGDRDIYFMVWDTNKQYMDVLKAYYPEGQSEPYITLPNNNVLFNTFHVTAEQLLAHRFSHATYTPADGQLINRSEEGIGTGETSKPPDGIAYPAQAVWNSNIVVPGFGRYRFFLDTDVPGSFAIDGTQVITNTGGGHGEVVLVLARGVHSVRLDGTTESPGSKVALTWAPGDSQPMGIARQYLWMGEGRGFTGLIYPGLFSSSEPTADGASGAGGVTSARVDGFLGYRDTPGVADGQTFSGSWTGTLNVAQPGDYVFDTRSRGETTLLVDGGTVLRNIAASGGVPSIDAQGTVHLENGTHNIEVRYTWTASNGYLDVFWQPPGGNREILTFKNLTTQGGIVTVPVQGEAPSVQLEPQDGARARHRGPIG